MSAIPQAVLGDKLGEARAGRRVRAAVFTTFTLDPGFFELHILPLVFDRVSPIEKVKRIQLEDFLQTCDVAVYYDRTGLVQNALPAQSNFRRIDVRRLGKGLFHPKLVLLLVENSPEEPEAGEEDEEPTLSLLVGAMSANLTRAGWWENVETAHFEEVRDVAADAARIPFRRDLLSVIRRVRDLASEDDHTALDQIHDFLRDRTQTETMTLNRHAGRYFTRMFDGQRTLAAWLAELGLDRGEWNLEIISPYFDHVGTLDALCDALSLAEVRVFLPTRSDGAVEVTCELYRAIAVRAAWAKLPDAVVRSSGRKQSDTVPDRWVHAKVYRFWKAQGPEVVLCGSVNLTAAAHSHGGAGNLEAAFLLGMESEQRRSWWLKRLDAEPTDYAPVPGREDEAAQEIAIDVTLRFDWRDGVLAYRIDSDVAEPFRIRTLDGRELARINEPRMGGWRECDDQASGAVRELLASTSLVELSTARGSWNVLVREEGMVHRPSLIARLTPEEILMYWSLLSPEQREAFLEKKLEAEALQEGLPASASGRPMAGETVFDRFAGIYHAFGRLGRHVDGALARGDALEAEARLFGAKYDSLPVLLDRLLERDEADRTITYVTFLCARQIRDRVRREHRAFWKDCRAVQAKLEERLNRLPDIRAGLLQDDPERESFLAWYEKAFLQQASIPVEEAD